MTESWDYIIQSISPPNMIVIYTKSTPLIPFLVFLFTPNRPFSHNHAFSSATNIGGVVNIYHVQTCKNYTFTSAIVIKSILIEDFGS